MSVHTLVKISVVVTISMLPLDSFQFNILYAASSTFHKSQDVPSKSPVARTDQYITVQQYLENKIFTLSAKIPCTSTWS